MYMANTERIVQIINTQIQNRAAYNSLSIQLAKVEIINSTIRDIGQLKVKAYGAALKCVNCESISIKNTTFRNLSAQVGGAIYLQEQEIEKTSTSQYRYVISNSSFTNSNSYVGGAIYSDNAQSLNVEKSIFISCTALTAEATDNTIKQGSGGVIFFTCDSISLNCKLDIRASNNFTNNFAQIQGGVIYWDQVEPLILPQSGQRINNSAGLYGNFVGCFAQELIEITEETYNKARADTEKRQLNGLTQYPERQLDTLSSQQTVYNSQRSGGPLPVKYFALIDKYGHIIGSDSSSSVQIFVNTSFNTEVESNSFPPVLSGQNSFTLDSGIFALENSIFVGTPGYNYSILVQCDAIDQSKKSNIEYWSKKGKKTMNLDLLIELRLCRIGEQFTISGSCELCLNSYSLQQQTFPGQCIDCPTAKAICKGGSLIYPKPGFWRVSNISSTFIACLNPNACLGSTSEEDSPLGNCAQGYQGIICADCAADYSKTGDFKCSQCPNRLANIIRLAFIFFGLFLLFVFLIKSTLASAFDKDNITNIYFKMLINHFQLILMTSTFDLNWSKQITAFFSESNQVATVSTQVFSIDCFLDQREIGNTTKSQNQTKYETEETTQMRIFFLKLVLISLLPVIIILICFLIWSLIKCIKRELVDVYARSISSIVIALFLAHSSIVQYTFYDFKCMKIDSLDRVINDLEIVCWDKTHTLYSLVVALPSILVWGLGIPLFGLSILIKFRARLDTKYVRERFGFLYRGYKAKFFYWEIVIIYRKVLVIFIAIFIKSAGVMAQTLVVIFCLTLFFVVNSQVMPFNRKSLNYLECLSLISQMITLYLGLFFLVSKPQSWIDQNPDYASGAVVISPEVARFLFSLIVIFNIVFFSYWCFTAFIEIQNRIILKYSRVYLVICLFNNKEKLQKVIQAQQMKLDNQNFYERLLGLTDNVLELYKDGKITLNAQSIEKLENLFSTDKVIAAAGAETVKRLQTQKSLKKNHTRDNINSKRQGSQVLTTEGAAETKPDVKMTRGRRYVSRESDDKIRNSELRDIVVDIDNYEENLSKESKNLSNEGLKRSLTKVNPPKRRKSLFYSQNLFKQQSSASNLSQLTPSDQKQTADSSLQKLRTLQLQEFQNFSLLNPSQISSIQQRAKKQPSQSNKISKPLSSNFEKITESRYQEEEESPNSHNGMREDINMLDDTFDKLILNNSLRFSELEYHAQNIRQSSGMPNIEIQNEDDESSTNIQRQKQMKSSEKIYQFSQNLLKNYQVKEVQRSTKYLSQDVNKSVNVLENPDIKIQKRARNKDRERKLKKRLNFKEMHDQGKQSHQKSIYQSSSFLEVPQVERKLSSRIKNPSIQQSEDQKQQSNLSSNRRGQDEISHDSSNQSSNPFIDSSHVSKEEIKTMNNASKLSGQTEKDFYNFLDEQEREQRNASALIKEELEKNEENMNQQQENKLLNSNRDKFVVRQPFDQEKSGLSSKIDEQIQPDNAIEIILDTLEQIRDIKTDNQLKGNIQKSIIPQLNLSDLQNQAIQEQDQEDSFDSGQQETTNNHSQVPQNFQFIPESQNLNENAIVKNDNSQKKNHQQAQKTEVSNIQKQEENLNSIRTPRNLNLYGSLILSNRQ